jgi:plastocyanin domain-containing protein
MFRTALLTLLALTCLPLAACQEAPADAHAGAAPDKPAAPAAAEAAIPANARRIEIVVNDEGFSPSTVDVKKGETVVLRFNRTTKSECLKAIAIPDLDIKKDLPMNTPVEVAITPQKEGKMVLQCWMAMIKATINVTG